MKVILELQDQPSNIRKVTVRHDIVIGRGAECNLRLSAPQVSRRHCFLRIGADGAYVSDLDSSNGTMLNGKRLSSGKRYVLEDGATLVVGPVQFIARVQAEVPAGQARTTGSARDQAGAESQRGAADPREVGFGTTMPDHSDADERSMNYSLEHSGPSTGQDEPTADCLTPDAARGVVQSDDFEIVELFEDDIAIVDELDDDVLADDEIVEVIDEDEYLLIDDDALDTSDAPQARIDDETLPARNDSGCDRVESELRDFLKDLD
ncbi:MAG: FHA domain-containing protein [Planctomycetaceae bacterium]